MHWLIATDSQVETGIETALSRVKKAGVFVEGNSFTKFIKPDYFVMVVRSDDLRIKTTAREALNRVSAFYLGDAESGNRHSLKAFLTKVDLPITEAKIFARTERDRLINDLSNVVFSATMASQVNALADSRIISVP